MGYSRFVLERFLERHAKEREKESMKEMKDYEEHLMKGALMFAMNAEIITPDEEKELHQRYCES